MSEHFEGLPVSEQIKALDAAIRQANEDFERTTQKDVNNPFYIPVQAKLGRGRLPIEAEFKEDEDATIDQINPIPFITGLPDDYSQLGAKVISATRPYIVCVVGQYGMGKTQLAYQIALKVRQECQGADDLRCLPINLPALASSPGHYGFQRMENVVRRAIDEILEKVDAERGRRYSLAREALYAGIRAGSVLLVLDGLDEICFDREHHDHFFRGLLKLLYEGSAPRGKAISTAFDYRVVVTMRREYVQSVAQVLAQDMTETIRNDAMSAMRTPSPSKSPPSVYFALLEALPDVAVRAYLRGLRQDTKDGLFTTIRDNYRALLQILRRPLLLNIFYRLILQTQDETKTLDEVSAGGVAELVRRFVASANEDRRLQVAQERIAAYTWDTDELARVSLDLYRRGLEPILTLQNVRKFVRPIEPDPEWGEEKRSKLKDETLESGIHKCPFLRREVTKGGGEAHYVFAHRLFYEYFTAKGIFLVRDEDKKDGFSGFDDLVPNVDIRQLLRDIVGGGEAWYGRTRRSYGLDNLDEWPDPRAEEQWKPMEQKRRVLLDFMTDPGNLGEGALKETVGAIDWFIRLSREIELHPRYLMYNQEAVSIYLYYYRWMPEAKEITGTFEASLDTQLGRLVKRLRSKDEDALRPARELLLERTLDIGHRLRCRWAKSFAKESGDAILGDASIVRSLETQGRIKAILANIQDTVY